MCEPISPFIVDAPGICRRTCHDSLDCRPDQYCSPSSLAPIIFDPLAPASLDPWGVPGPIVDRPNPFQPAPLHPWNRPFELRVCRDDGTCNAHPDCNDPNNQYIHPLCVGRGFCFGGHCGWVCGTPCVDLAGVDFGPCDALLGWGLVNGSCASISGCSASGLPLFPTREECTKACRLF